MGIPQGSVLSALLCSFFYGDLEKRFFKFSEDNQSVCWFFNSYSWIARFCWRSKCQSGSLPTYRRLFVYYNEPSQGKKFLRNDEQRYGSFTFVPCNLFWLATWIEGHPEYGCLISQDKTLTNFDYDAQVTNVTEPQQRRGFSVICFRCVCFDFEE